MKQLITCAVVAGCVCAVEGKTVIYQNDFSTRTSAVKAEPGPWTTYTYTLGNRLAYSYSNNWYDYSPDIHWLDPTQTQDGWVHGGACGYQEDAGGWFPGSFVSVNREDECPGDTTHRFGTFRFSSMHHTWCRLLQPIGNSFSNGVVRYTVDMRPPKWWGAKYYGAWPPLFRFYPAFRRDLRMPEIGSDTEENPCSIGFTWQGKTDSNDNTLVEGAFRNIRHGANDWLVGGAVVPGNWYRCHVDLDMDNETCFMSMDDMGDAVPSWDSAPVQANVLRMDQFQAWRPRRHDDRGPIDGIAFQVEGVSSFDVVTNMPSFTNIKVEWKAPGQDAFACCYENDFTTRRMRTLQPAVATFAYPEIVAQSGTMATNPSGVQRWPIGTLPQSGDSGLLVTKPIFQGNSLEPVGFDNWRRIYSTGWAFADVARFDDGNCVLRTSWPYGPDDTTGLYGCFAQPLGETITTGKVRMLVDIKTPARFWYTSNSGMYVCLGDDLHWTSYGESSASTYLSAAGIGCGGETLCYPEYKSNGSWPTGKNVYTCETSHWYRVETIVDLDAQSYSWSLYDLSNETPDTPVYSVADLAYARPDTRKNVAALSLSAYGPGYEAADVMLFDNIQVWKNWNVADGTGDEIYRNDFSNRVRPSVRAAENLGDAPNLTTDEKDRWTVRGGDADWVKRVVGANGNPCVSYFAMSCNAYAMQDFGTVIKRGRLTVSADIRPPNLWHKNSYGRDVSICVGGEKMAQGDLNKGSIWSTAAMCFGFDGAGQSWTAAGVCSSVAAYVTSGAATSYFDFTVDPSHWYRFKATANVLAKTYSVDVYDMGSSHPEADTSDGTLIGSQKGLDFTNGQVEALTTICLYGIGVRTDNPWEVEDSGSAFYDNLKVELVPAGFALLVR